MTGLDNEQITALQNAQVGETVMRRAINIDDFPSGATIIVKNDNAQSECQQVRILLDNDVVAQVDVPWRCVPTVMPRRWNGQTFSITTTTTLEKAILMTDDPSTPSPLGLVRVCSVATTTHNYHHCFAQYPSLPPPQSASTTICCCCCGSYSVTADGGLSMQQRCQWQWPSFLTRSRRDRRTAQALTDFYWSTNGAVVVA